MLIDAADGNANFENTKYWKIGLDKINIATNNDQKTFENGLNLVPKSYKNNSAFKMLLSLTQKNTSKKKKTQTTKFKCALCNHKKEHCSPIQACNNITLPCVSCYECSTAYNSPKIKMYMDKKLVGDRHMEGSCHGCAYETPKYKLNGENVIFTNLKQWSKKLNDSYESDSSSDDESW